MLAAVIGSSCSGGYSNNGSSSSSSSNTGSADHSQYTSTRGRSNSSRFKPGLATSPLYKEGSGIGPWQVPKTGESAPAGAMGTLTSTTRRQQPSLMQLVWAASSSGAQNVMGAAPHAATATAVHAVGAGKGGNGMISSSGGGSAVGSQGLRGGMFLAPGAVASSSGADGGEQGKCRLRKELLEVEVRLIEQCCR